MPSNVPTAPAKMTAVNPTTSEMRAPKISRDSTSRPSWSVPSRYSVLPPVSQNGGLKRAVRMPTSGLCGANWLAKTATTVMTPRIASGMTGIVAEADPANGRERAAAPEAGWLLLGCPWRQLPSRMRGSITA